MQRQKQWTQVGVRNAKKKATDNDKNIRAFRKATSEKQAAKISQSEKALARLDAVDKPWEPWDLRLEIAAAPTVRRGRRPPRGQWSCDGAVSSSARSTSRSAGPTASPSSGRTARASRRSSPPCSDGSPLDEGTAHLGPGVVVGEIDQGRGLLDSDQLARRRVHPGGRLGRRRRRCHRRPHLARQVRARRRARRPPVRRTLSPGERTRATLALLQARGTNCLVLDEPTNHLDLPAIEQLEQAVEAFEGTVLLVTHDRQLLDAITTTRTFRLHDGLVSET